MPLSEHEQRMLEQMERALYAEDPKFASALEGTGLRTFTRRRVYQAVAGFLVGVALLMGGMIAKLTWVGVAGFLVMLACAVLAVTGWRKAGRPAEAVPPGRQGRLARRHQPRKGKVMDRIEERWQRRRDEQGQ
ncbi:DUF3040 domain-containing protein [Actinacidiphila bryophytorum]|uniref:DUF3040 domain-containing protein n=2 Tax=Actinacidiphila bryophytorum TaxID=1436133 RepID=A0A9W4E751_9ACTN|nr:DUF3040 domain-containing protein [Actinacidiphila bryophytorum]MBM9436267.1 DUF3040 domain-containing protein [Actinacidiphila bryophytorum]CAG7632410.1 conserved hypothetical protein [Actinacidiphila bryophytorum]